MNVFGNVFGIIFCGVYSIIPFEMLSTISIGSDPTIFMGFFRFLGNFWSFFFKLLQQLCLNSFQVIILGSRRHLFEILANFRKNFRKLSGILSGMFF